MLMREGEGKLSIGRTPDSSPRKWSKRGMVLAGEGEPFALQVCYEPDLKVAPKDICKV
jgi:hypothetical protein